MRLNVIVNVNCDAGLLLTVRKRLITTCEAVMEVVQTALRGDTDIANIIGSISQHVARLPELNTNFVPDRDIQVYVNLPMQAIHIKYAEHQTFNWRICPTEISHFLELEAGGIWDAIERMSYAFNITNTISGRTS